MTSPPEPVPSLEETIVAISTPPGRGGIGIVRLSGPDSVAIASPMLRLKNPLVHAQARFAEIIDCSAQQVEETTPSALSPGPAQVIDQAVVTLFTASTSYTGEDLVEIAAHGSPVVMELLLRQAIAGGARLAEPGEFTQRAFFCGRIDLTQAEAVRDLIEAQTIYQARVAASQMGGALSRGIQPAKEALVTLIATMEAGIDFAEDDIDVMPGVEILTRIAGIRLELVPVEASFARGRIVHGGLTLAIVGRPNVGKSSLFNRLVERERAIVTATPGTTRDLVTERVSIGGIPVDLVDTAGLREAADEAESIGIQKSREALAEADVAVVVMDAAAQDFDQEAEVLRSLEGRPHLAVLNKVDLLKEAGPLADPGGAAVRVSAKTGHGILELRAKILALAGGPSAGDHGAMLTNLRQHETISATLKSLGAAAGSIEARVPHEMVMLDLYAALGNLDALTGQTTPDDILNQIFSSFCIGK